MVNGPAQQIPRIGIGIMILKEGKVLMGRRKKAGYGMGEYEFPGGNLEYGESFEDCARREVQEECGLEIKNLKFVLLENHRDVNHYVCINFVAEWVAGEPVLKEPDKNEGWTWYDLDKLPTPIVRPNRRLIEAYKTGVYYRDE